jgi:Cu+-exporting ATPase
MEEAHIAKLESQDVVHYLRNQLGMRVAMITGDNKHAAYKVARHLGINTEDVVYKAYPEDKRKAVELLQGRGEKVMFVGDGINDSPVLAQADVGVAINSGSDITVNAAGIIIMKDSLYDVVNAIAISRQSFRRIKINFCWAFVYNILLIPIAMGALYPVNFRMDPMLAGFAMALSSISVVVSSLFLKLFKPITAKNFQTHNGNMDTSSRKFLATTINFSGITQATESIPHGGVPAVVSPTQSEKGANFVIQMSEDLEPQIS